MAEEEVALEVEAVEAVYGDDCVVINAYPPHLHLHIKPRTADDSSQQFVEAIVGMKAGPKYPEEPPHISIIDSKGLDEQRQKYLVNCIREKSCELSSYLMLVALCEEAVDQLSNMNHPDGNCPLCLCPLVDEDGGNESLPFMKLLSCFHCFHGTCIIRWWNWLQMQKEEVSSSSTLSSHHSPDKKGMHEMMEERMGQCPVCRKVFHAKDIEHVLNLVGTTSLDSNGIEDKEGEDILHSDSEKIRRQKFEAILQLQQENSGLIEPKKNEVLLPGMYLPRSVPSSTETSDKETVEQRRDKETQANSMTNSSSSSRPSSSRGRYTGARKHKGHNTRKQARQWIKKESNMTS